MGTETSISYKSLLTDSVFWVKLNNPLMGTETKEISYLELSSPLTAC